MSKNSKRGIDSLRSKAHPEPNTSADVEPSGPTARYLIYAGKSGRDADFDHEGHWVCFAPGTSEPLTLWPGLNVREISDADWAAYKKHAPVAEALGNGWLASTDAELSDQREPSKWRQLCAITTGCPRGLELLVNIEGAKPIHAGRTRRRDNSQLELLQRRLKIALRRAPVDIEGIAEAAANLAEVAKPKVA